MSALGQHDRGGANQHPALLEREDCTLVAWYRSLYAPRTGGAYDSHHRTTGVAGCTRRRGGRVAARCARAAGRAHAGVLRVVIILLPNSGEAVQAARSLSSQTRRSMRALRIAGSSAMSEAYTADGATSPFPINQRCSAHCSPRCHLHQSHNKNRPLPVRGYCPKSKGGPPRVCPAGFKPYGTTAKNKNTAKITK